MQKLKSWFIIINLITLNTISAQTVDSMSVPPIIPLQFALSLEARLELEPKAYAGDLEAAEKLYTHYNLVIQNEKARDHWSMIATLNGSDSCLYNYLQISTYDSNLEFNKIKMRFTKQMYDKHSDKWDTEMKKKIIELCKSEYQFDLPSGQETKKFKIPFLKK